MGGSERLYGYEVYDRWNNLSFFRFVSSTISNSNEIGRLT